MKTAVGTALKQASLTNPLIKIAISIAFALVIAVSARVSFITPLSPVPVTLQTASILLAGFLLGPRWGMLSVLSYISIGLLGAPVFAMGVAGPAIFLSPTFGYILAFPIVTWLVGFLSERVVRSFKYGILIGFAGITVLFAIGMIWLTGFKLTDGMGFTSAFGTAWSIGVLPFLMVDICKVLLATGIWCLAGNIYRQNSPPIL